MQISIIMICFSSRFSFFNREMQLKRGGAADMRYSSNFRVQSLAFVTKFLWCEYSNENSQAVLSRGVIYFSLLHENNLLLFSFWFETLYEIEWMTQKQVRGWYLWLNFVGWLVGGNVQLLWVYIKISSSCKKEKPMDNKQWTKKWIWKNLLPANMSQIIKTEE